LLKQITVDIMTNRIDFEKRLERTKKYSDVALQYHSFYKGKIQMMPKCSITNDALAVWYTPGVAASCKSIQNDLDHVWDQTNRGNSVAIVSDGTRVLGLGDIGPEASLPALEGKALLFKYLGGVDAFPVCLKTKDPAEIVRTCELIEPNFGGINLEDIEKPKCFHVLDNVRGKCRIPVWHDDQQGTAAVILAGLINALKIVGKERKQATITLFGSGAANVRTAFVLIRAGFKAGNLTMVDTKGILEPDRSDIEEEREENPWKYQLSHMTNAEGRQGGADEAFKGADAVVAASRPGPNVIKPMWIKTMATNAIVFACANPVPEIWPWEAKEAGAKVVGTGRCDFENQINNSLGFPAIFRGVLDVRAKTITDDMCVAAAEELARFAEERGINEGDIIPHMDEWEVYPLEAVACALESIKEGVARIKPSRDELLDKATEIIKTSRESAQLLIRKGLIKQLPRKGVL
jgi:malate dehydrogenase (oxaloacetate-decarboxylating)